MANRITFDEALRNYEPVPESGCWIWLGPVSVDGYGKMSFSGKHGSAHRVFYETFVGPIPQGLEIDHLCRVVCCVNPNHLEPVTPRENVRRGFGLAGMNARKTHCPQGHEFTPDNVIKDKNKRRCKTCRNAFARQKWLTRKYWVGPQRKAKRDAVKSLRWMDKPT